MQGPERSNQTGLLWSPVTRLRPRPHLGPLLSVFPPILILSIRRIDSPNKHLKIGIFFYKTQQKGVNKWGRNSEYSNKNGGAGGRFLPVSERLISSFDGLIPIIKRKHRGNQRPNVTWSRKHTFISTNISDKLQETSDRPKLQTGESDHQSWSIVKRRDHSALVRLTISVHWAAWLLDDLENLIFLFRLWTVAVFYTCVS